MCESCCVNGSHGINISKERYFINHHCSHRLNYGIFTNTDDNKRENKKNFLHLIDMAKNKTVLQTLGFT